jgi:hypothetical protein
MKNGEVPRRRINAPPHPRVHSRLNLIYDARNKPRALEHVQFGEEARHAE